MWYGYLTICIHSRALILQNIANKYKCADNRTTVMYSYTIDMGGMGLSSQLVTIKWLSSKVLVWFYDIYRVVTWEPRGLPMVFMVRHV